MRSNLAIVESRQAKTRLWYNSGVEGLLGICEVPENTDLQHLLNIRGAHNQRGAETCENCPSCKCTYKREECGSPGAQGEGDTGETGWLTAAGEGWGFWSDVALSRLSSFQLSPLVSSSSRGLVALSMSYRRSDTDQSMGGEVGMGKRGGKAKQEARAKKQGPCVSFHPEKVPPSPSSPVLASSYGLTQALPTWPYPLYSQGGNAQHSSPANT